MTHKTLKQLAAIAIVCAAAYVRHVSRRQRAALRRGRGRGPGCDPENPQLQQPRLHLSLLRGLHPAAGTTATIPWNPDTSGCRPTRTPPAWSTRRSTISTSMATESMPSTATRRSSSTPTSRHRRACVGTTWRRSNRQLSSCISTTQSNTVLGLQECAPVAVSGDNDDILLGSSATLTMGEKSETNNVAANGDFELRFANWTFTNFGEAIFQFPQPADFLSAGGERQHHPVDRRHLEHGSPGRGIGKPVLVGPAPGLTGNETFAAYSRCERPSAS